MFFYNPFTNIHLASKNKQISFLNLFLIHEKIHKKNVQKISHRKEIISKVFWGFLFIQYIILTNIFFRILYLILFVFNLA